MGCNGSRPKLNDVFSPLLAEFFFGNCKSGPPSGGGRQKNTITNYVSSSAEIQDIIFLVLIVVSCLVQFVLCHPE